MRPSVFFLKVSFDLKHLSVTNKTQTEEIHKGTNTFCVCERWGFHGYRRVGVVEVEKGAEISAVGQELLQPERWETIQQLTLIRDQLPDAGHTQRHTHTHI